MAGIRDEDDMDLLALRILQPLSDVVVDDALGQGVALEAVAGEGEVLVEGIALVGIVLACRLLRAVAGVGEDQRVAFLASARRPFQAPSSAALVTSLLVRSTTRSAPLLSSAVAMSLASLTAPCRSLIGSS
jgi:hypothetical protein